MAAVSTDSATEAEFIHFIFNEYADAITRGINPPNEDGGRRWECAQDILNSEVFVESQTEQKKKMKPIKFHVSPCGPFKDPKQPDDGVPDDQR